MRRSIALVALAAIAALGGCADPYEPAGTTPRGPTAADSAGGEERTPRRQPPADGELEGTVPSELQEPEPTRFPGAGRTPRATVARGVDLYGNWTSETAPRRFRAIAAISVGEARAQLRQVAADSRADAQQTGATSRAHLVAVELRGSGADRTAVIVTRERVQGEGIPAAGPRYRVTLARLKRRGGRWVISQWTPQP